MIVVNVDLKSAISRTRDKRLAQFVIINDNSGGDRLRNYDCISYHGRSEAELAKRTVQRQGRVEGHLADAVHVLNLVAKALTAMGYGNGP